MNHFFNFFDHEYDSFVKDVYARSSKADVALFGTGDPPGLGERTNDFIPSAMTPKTDCFELFLTDSFLRPFLLEPKLNAFDRFEN